MTITLEAVRAAIESGEMDNDLGALSTLVENRLAAVRSSKKATDFGIGDKVRFNNNCGTRYLVGATARVTGMKRTKIVVQLEKPQGRFARYTPTGTESANITVPISIVDPA